MARRNRRAPAPKRAAPARKAAAKKKKKKAPAKRGKASLAKGYWEALERLERELAHVKALVTEIHAEITPPKAAGKDHSDLDDSQRDGD